MRIQTETNLLFDDAHPKCMRIVSTTQGQNLAFIQCLDIGTSNNQHEEPHIKRYWGKWSYEQPELAIKQIMANGSQWPLLPH